MPLTNSLGRTADDPCNVYCSEDDYVAWRELAVSVRRTLVARHFAGTLEESDRAALADWLTAWIEPSGNLIEDATSTAKALQEADPRDVPLRWPVTWESSILIPVPITVARRTAAIREIADYAERGDRLAERLKAEKAEQHEEAARPDRANGLRIPWGFLALGAGVTIAVGVGGYVVYRKTRAAVGARRKHKAGNPAVCSAAYGELSAKERAGFSSSAFGLPERRAYPMPDISHARNAKSRAAAEYRAGRLSRSDFERVARKADRIIAGCKGAA